MGIGTTRRALFLCAILFLASCADFAGVPPPPSPTVPPRAASGLSPSPEPRRTPTADPDVRRFPETGHALRGAFRRFWERHGGLAAFGLPLTQAVAIDGATVQYFERARFESRDGSTVEIGRLGAEALLARGVPVAVAAAQPKCRFFPETRHNLCEPFKSFWQSHGGLAIFGLPITEAHAEASPTDGRTYTVQYFERNRFEHHPEHPAAFRVQLGLLGSEIYGKRLQAPAAAIDPAMQRLVDLTNAARRDAGLAALAVSPALMGVAASYSQVQAAQGAINHTGPDGSSFADRISRAGYRWSYCAENLAAGYGGPDEVFAAWMNSAGHRANILNPNVREIGVGVTHRPDDPGRMYNYWVMVLAAPR